MAKIFKNNNIPLFFLIISSLFFFFSTMVESGAGPDVNVLTKFCTFLKDNSNGDPTKLQRSTECNNYLTTFKTGDWSAFIGIKFIETSNSISIIMNKTNEAMMNKQNPNALEGNAIKQCLQLHQSSLSKIDEAYDIYKKNGAMNKAKNAEFEDVKKRMESLVIEETRDQETCQKSIVGMKGAPPQITEASNLAEKVISGSKYLTKAICQFGYAPKNSQFC